MKNLARPLAWEEGQWKETEIAYVHDFSAMYLATEFKSLGHEYVARLEIEDNVVWQATNLKTIEKAKAACQQHYAESLWDNLSPEVQAILKQHLNPQTPNT